MQRLLLSISFFLFSLMVMAQTIPPRLQLDPTIDANVSMRLRHALHSLGVQIDSTAPIRLFAELEAGNAGQLDAMQQRNIQTVTLLLEARYPGEERLISTAWLEFRGSGTNASAAQRQAINQIRPTHAGLKRWVIRYQSDIDQFFGENCAQLLETASTYADREDWREALAIAHGIPREATCYAEATPLVDRYYDAFQESSCNEQLRLAQLALTQQQAKVAIDALAQIDPTSSCAGEAEQLLNQAAQQLQGQEVAKAAFLRQVYQNQVQLETARQEIMEEVVKGRN